MSRDSIKLLVLNNEFPPLGGGTGVVCKNFLEQLASYPNISADLVTTSATGTYKEVSLSKNVTCFYLPITIKNVHHATLYDLILYSIKSLILCVRLSKNKHYDLCFAYSAAPAGGVSVLLKFLRKIPYIVSLQGPDIPGFEVRYKYIYPFLKPILKFIWKNADKVIALSQSQRELAHKTAPLLDITLIPNGVDLSQFQQEEPKSKNSEKGINILSVGRLIERKRIDRIILAVAEIMKKHADMDIHCFIAGTGDEESSLKELVRTLNLEKAVTFMGAVPNNKMPLYYKQADIFVLPSDHEGMSIALLEALASGLPAIVSNTGGTSELVEHGVNGIVLPKNKTDDIEAALTTLINNAPLRKAMGEKSRARAEKYSWSAMTDTHIQCFMNVLQK